MGIYNYETFPIDMQPEVFENFPNVITAGNKGPDGRLIDAITRKEIYLSDLWAESTLVIEFGSIT